MLEARNTNIFLFIAGELLTASWQPFLSTTKTFVDVPTNLLQWTGDGDVFGRRCQSSMDVYESCCLRQRSLDQRQCVSATCSVHSSQSDRDAKKDITVPSADDFYPCGDHVLKDDAGTLLNWSEQSISRPTVNDLARNSQETSQTALKVDSPGGIDFNVSLLWESTSLPRDGVQNESSIEEKSQFHSASHHPPTSPFTAAAAASVAMTTADVPNVLEQPNVLQVCHNIIYQF